MVESKHFQLGGGIHGTTREQVAVAFAREKAALLPLPVGRFPCFQEAKRIVNRDGHVEVAKACYSAPPEFVGRTLWARWDTHTVRLLDEGMKQVAMHARREPGQFATAAGHIHPAKRSAAGPTHSCGSAASRPCAC